MNTTIYSFLTEKVILVLILGCTFLSLVVLPIRAEALMAAEPSTTQQELIQQLLKTIAELQAQLKVLQNKGAGTSVVPVPALSCDGLSQSMWLGLSDRTTNGQVSKLQKFLSGTGDYTYGEITGYYGLSTQSAVQSWQKSNGVVSYGTPESNGYGVVGRETLAAMVKNCKKNNEGITQPSIVQESSPTLELSVSPDVIRIGGLVKLSWSSTNAKYCTVGSGDKAETSGVLTIDNIKETRIITATCYNNNKKIAKSVTVKVEEQKIDDGGVLYDDGGVVVMPKRNVMDCDNPLSTGLSTGALACYGVWDYGDDFGGDKYMCSGNGSGLSYSTMGTGCEIQTKACKSGYAKAVKSYSISSLSSLKTIANNLDVSEAALKKGMVNVWEYQCSYPPTPGTQYTVYKGYLNGSSQPFITTENISREIALSNCKLNHSNNPTKQIRCTYNDDEIYSFTPTVETVVVNPTARVSATTNITSTSVRLNGVVNAQGLSNVTSSFRYGTSASTCAGSGQDTIVSSVPSSINGSYDAQVYSDVTGLRPNTKYYACMEFSDRKNGVDNVNVISFTTLSTSASDNPTPGTYPGLNQLYGSSVTNEVTQCTDLSVNMHRGAESSAVLSLQKFLRAKEYLPVEPTAYYGDLTVNAVKVYQQSVGLPTSGMAYELTRVAIKNETCSQ